MCKPMYEDDDELERPTETDHVWVRGEATVGHSWNFRLRANAALWGEHER